MATGFIWSVNVSFLQSISQPHEKLLAEGRLHYVVYAQPLLVLLTAVIVFFLGSVIRHNGQLVLLWVIVTACLFVFALISALRAWFEEWITEITVTNQRIICKTGFLPGQSREISKDGVESVTVRQSMLGRLLDYGTIDIRKSGDRFEHMHRVASPHQLRDAIAAR